MRMRAALALSFATLTAVAAAPVDTSALDGDASAPEPKICEVPGYASSLTLEGFSELVTAPDATLGDGEKNDLYFIVDLGPDAYEDTRGSVTGELSWTIVTNDYDLAVGGSSSAQLQPLAAPVETASASVAHCQLVTVSTIDFLAPLALEELQLDLTVTRNS
jgi:hypothetical protein